MEDHNILVFWYGWLANLAQLTHFVSALRLLSYQSHVKMDPVAAFGYHPSLDATLGKTTQTNVHLFLTKVQVDFAAHVACSVKHVGRVEKDAEAKVAENSMLGMRGKLHLRVGSFRAQFGVACLLVAPLSSCLLKQTPNGDS